MPSKTIKRKTVLRRAAVFVCAVSALLLLGLMMDRSRLSARWRHEQSVLRALAENAALSDTTNAAYGQPLRAAGERSAPSDPDTETGHHRLTSPAGSCPKTIPCAADDGTDPRSEAWVKTLREQFGNDDILGTVECAALDMLLPFVRSRDNADYLDKGLDGQKNAAGTVFLDARNTSANTDKNTILYGHNMGTGEQFGRLHTLSHPETAQGNAPAIIVTASSGQRRYDIVAVVRISDRADELPTAPDATWVADKINRSVPAFNVRPPQDCEETDYLSLVTCHGLGESERLLVLAAGRRPR